MRKATTTISLTTTVSTGQGNSTTARVLLRDGSRSDSLQELTITLEQNANPELSAHRRSNTPRILLRYTACTGLINQQYSHIAAFTLAAVLRADIVLPPAVCRDSFEHYFHISKEKNEVKWSPIPTEKILDVASIKAVCASLGIQVLEAPQLEPFPDITIPESAYPAYERLPEGVTDRGAVTRLSGVYLKHRELWELEAMARSAVTNVTALLSAMQLGEGGRGRAGPPPVVVVDLPCTFFAINTASALPLVSKVAQSLAFSPTLKALAERVVEQLSQGGRRPFNGVHLRVENDARDWAAIMGGKGQVWHEYVLTMRAAGYNTRTPLYVACGLLSYGAAGEWQETQDILLHRGIASSLHHKEEFLPEAELKELNSEQLALVDFLVLARATRLVGIGSSTFSYYLREYRALHYGLPKSTTVLVNASRIGTDKLFAAAGPVVEDPEVAQLATLCSGVLSRLRPRCWRTTWGSISGGRGSSSSRVDS
ncbi:hypothetical protein N2152v2_001843 [Parachlorella kessleri]